MACRCGEDKRFDRAHTFKRTVAGCTFTAEVLVDACAGCEEPNVPAALVIAFERALAIELARRGPITGETFRWIRKAAAIERVDLAHFLGVSPEVIASWEEERRAPDVAAWTIVAAIALDTMEGPRPLRTRIRARRRTAPVPERNAALSEPRSLVVDPRATGSISRILELLASTVALTEVDVADTFDIDCASLRARLRELCQLGLIVSVDSPNMDVVRWVATSRDWRALVETAARAGVDVDAPLPRAKRSVDARSNGSRSRVSPAAWRSV